MSALLSAAEKLHPEKIESNNWGLYFHGTGSVFDAFSEFEIGKGADANCALGVFVTNRPFNAARYADMVAAGTGEGHVLVVLLNESQNDEFCNFESFYGADWPTGSSRHNRKHFQRLRTKLAKDYTATWFTPDDDGAIGVALRVEDAIIIGRVSCEVARKLDDDEIFWSGGEDHTDPAFKRNVLGRLQELTDERFRGELSET